MSDPLTVAALLARPMRSVSDVSPTLFPAIVTLPIAAVPSTWSVYVGAVVPIPTLPLVNTALLVPFPTTWSLAAGAVVPIPMFPPV